MDRTIDLSATAVSLTTAASPVIVNFCSLAPGMIEAINHPAMPDLASLQHGTQTETWCLVERGKLGAICSLWVDGVPASGDTRKGDTRGGDARQGDKRAAVGHFFALDTQVGSLLLDFACTRLRMLGADYVVGPLDGDTWHRYRLVTNPGDRAPFFLEYYTPCDWSAIFTEAGFAPIETYRSAQTTTAAYHDRSAEKFAKRAAEMGLTLRSFIPATAEPTLAALYDLSVQSFAHNAFYTPITREEFLALYQPLLPYIVPDLFLLAEHEGQLVGFVLALPDYMQRARGETIDTIVIKTLARHPARCYAGMGSYLAQEVHRRAAAMGYSTAIHALMHDGNASRIISDKSAQTIRQYALYGKTL